MNCMSYFLCWFLCRNYATDLKKPYDLAYDPFTHRVSVLNNKEHLDSFAEQVKSEVELLHRAIDMMGGDNCRKRTTDSE